jgi:hypothetical protein
MADSPWKNFTTGLQAVPSKIRSLVMQGTRPTTNIEPQEERVDDIAPEQTVAATEDDRGYAEYGSDIKNERIPGTLDLGIFYNHEKNERRVAKIPQKDRATHLYVVGATGTGKTKFLECLIRQDIVNGQGFGVIDPHGDLIEELKGFLAYRYADDAQSQVITDRIVLIDPTDPLHTVTFNPLEEISGVSVAEQAAELISAFKKIWADSWGVRMEDLLRNTLIALGEAELTLCELTQFLTHRAYRTAILDTVSNPTTTDYFQRFDALTDRSQLTWIEPVMNKINAFLADERMRQMFSAPHSSFNLREIMDQRKQLLIKLDKGKLKGASDLLGSLFMAKIQMSAFSRSGIPAHQRIPFYLYIDEFQNFASESFEVILSEARKYGLSLIMAHQSLSQIPDALRGLILASAGLQVYFRVNRQDAQLLAKEMFRYSGFEVKSEGVSKPIYWSHGEEWELKIGRLQHLSPRTCLVKHKIQGGAIELQTVSIESPSKMLAMHEAKYLAWLKTIPFGGKYLRVREDLATEMSARKHLADKKTTALPQVQHPVTVESQPVPEPIDLANIEAVQPTVVKVTRTRTRAVTNREVLPQASPSIEREHRRLQHLIKHLAQQHGYRATLEEPTVDGQGRVDVGLERDGSKIACEISVTSTPEQELGNIEKCLASGYERVLLCSENKSLTKIQALVARRLTEPELQKVIFVAPDALVFYFEEEAAGRASKEDRVNGYKVKVNFQPMAESEKETKRKTLARVFVQSTHRNEPAP